MAKTSSAPKAYFDPAKVFDDIFDDGPSPVGPNDKPIKQTGEPKFTFLGKPIYSPFGIPAGTLPNSKFIKYAFERGFDVVDYKTQRTDPFTVNPFPNIVYVDAGDKLTIERAAKPLLGSPTPFTSLEKTSITNSFGNPSRGPKFWVEDMKKAHGYQGRGQLLIGGVVGTIKPGFSDDDYYDDFAEAARLAASSGVEAVEVNLSCPNVAAEGILCFTHDAVVAVCQKTRAKIGNLPLVVKFGYFTKAQQKLLEQTVKDIAPYVNAISAINTIPAPVVDKNGKQILPGPGRLSAGICGASIKWAGLDMVKRLDQLRKKQGYKYEIIGVGGVMNVADFHQYRKNGADLVQSATGSMWNPQLAQQIKASL